VKAPHNGVRDHHRMDKTQHTGLVTVIVLVQGAGISAAV
jgi:hypothetical protein